MKHHHHLSSRPPPPPQSHRKRQDGVSSPLTLITLSCAFFFLLHSRTPSFPKPYPLDPALSIRTNEPQSLEDYQWSRQQDAHNGSLKRCATVEEMGQSFLPGPNPEPGNENLRIREVVRRHFKINGAGRVRHLPEEFCRHGFVLGKAAEAGFGNEMYKILTGAALSIMLNRSLIIGQTRHICTLFYWAYTHLASTFHAQIIHLL